MNKMKIMLTNYLQKTKATYQTKNLTNRGRVRMTKIHQTTKRRMTSTFLRNWSLTMRKKAKAKKEKVNNCTTTPS
jgi:hypothetical protein